MAAICDAVGAKRRSHKKIMLSLDEWNVWYRARDAQSVDGKRTFAPKLLEEVYNLEDALLVGALVDDVEVQVVAGEFAVHQLHTTDFHHAIRVVRVIGVKTRGFCVQKNLAHSFNNTQWVFFRRAPPRKNAPLGGSDPRSGGAWG